MSRMERLMRPAFTAGDKPIEYQEETQSIRILGFWLFLAMLQVARKGITPITARKVFIVNLYWHFLDVVWVFIFTIVYLSGVVM